MFRDTGEYQTNTVEIHFADFPLILGGYDLNLPAEGVIEIEDGRIVAIVLEAKPDLICTHADYLRNKDGLKGLVWAGLHDQLADYYADEIRRTLEPWRKTQSSEYI